MIDVRLAFALLSLAPAISSAQGFDWGLLGGTWAESTEHDFGCRPDNLHQQFVVSKDRKTLTFRNDRSWKIETGVDVKEYRAQITRAQDRSLFIRYDTDLGGSPPAYPEWEMRFIGPGTYRWRAVAWPKNQFNMVIGVKCKN